MKINFKQCWLIITAISIKRTVTSELNSWNTKKETMTYNDGNLGPGLEQAQKCGGLNHSLRS